MRTKEAKPAPVKIYELINWLVGPDIDIPDRFLEQKTKLNSLVPYITEQLWIMPELVAYLNDHINDLYNIPDPIEQLKLYKKLFRNRNIQKSSLYQRMPDFKPDIIKQIEEQEGYDEGNARGKEALLRAKFGFLEAQKLYTKQKTTKAAAKQATTEEDKELVKSLLQQEADAKKAKRAKVDSGIYITELTQELIDREELVLFDISLLKKRNQVLFIFIDKNNHKKYYIEPFKASIYVSTREGVINNDYITELNDTDFVKYIFQDIKQYTRLKYILNDSYKKVINGIG